MEARGGVIGPAQDVEHLHQVVRRLVRRDLPDVEQVAAALVYLAPGQRRRQLGIGLVALGLHVDQQGHHRGAMEPQRLELGLVERGVGDGEAALRGETRQLCPPERDLVGDGGLPVAQQVGGVMLW